MTQPSGTSLTARWLAGGGTAYNGMSYGPPASASAWGLAGCPLAPRLYRSAFGELLLPPAICSDLGVPRLTLADSGQDVWLRRDQAELSAESRQELSAFLYDLEVPEEGVAIPGGVPNFLVNRFTNYPTSAQCFTQAQMKYAVSQAARIAIAKMPH